MAVFSTKAFFMYFSTFFQKLRFRIFQFSQWNYIETYNYLYWLDSEKSKVYYFINFCPRKKNPGYTRPQNFGQKDPKKMTIFKANPRLLENSYCPKMILTYNIWTFIYKKISNSRPLLVFVSMKYCTKNRLLKTHTCNNQTVKAIWLRIGPFF